MWRERRRERMRQLEDAVAEAQASQAELMRRLELFEKIAATAGVELGERQQTADVPEPLVAAARDRLGVCSEQRSGRDSLHGV